MRVLLFALPLAITLSACGSGESDTPNVAEPYQAGIQRAWDVAESGELPTISCASVTGAALGRARASSADRNEAVRAFEACYVDIHAHWVNQRLERADETQSSCMAIMTGLMSSRMSLGSMANDLDLEVGDLDRQLAGKISDQVNRHCPSLAATILGE